MLNFFFKLFSACLIGLFVWSPVYGDLYQYRAATWSEKGIGVFLFRKCTSGFQYLLLQTSPASLFKRQWVIVTVRLTPSENDETAIQKVMYKKTGIKTYQFKIINDFLIQSRITINRRGVHRKMSYYLAQLINPSQRIRLSKFFDNYTWVPLDEARKLITHSDQVKFMQTCQNFLRKYPEEKFFTPTDKEAC